MRIKKSPQIICGDFSNHFYEGFEASTPICNVCGYRHPEMTLEIRSWTCPDCGTCHDRDINAAKNIYKIGKSKLTGGTSSDTLGDVRPSFAVQNLAVAV